MESVIILVHVIAAIGITGLVLIQHGKGADMGASFGSGASQTMFGSIGTSNALTKTTAWLATIFFATSLVLALFAKQQAGQSIQDDGLIENTSVLTEIPLQTTSDDLPVLTVDNAASDIPQTPTAEQAEPPVIDEALQAALQQAVAEAMEAQDETAQAADPATDVQEAAPAEEPAQ